MVEIVLLDWRSLTLILWSATLRTRKMERRVRPPALTYSQYTLYEIAPYSLLSFFFSPPAVIRPSSLSSSWKSSLKPDTAETAEAVEVSLSTLLWTRLRILSFGVRAR